jgi:hypothetical protein
LTALEISTDTVRVKDLVVAGTTTGVSASDDTKLPLTGGAMTGAITTNSTFDGIDIATRDAILTSTTTTANAALPKAGGTMSGDISHASDFTIDSGGDIALSADGGNITMDDGTNTIFDFDVDAPSLKIMDDADDADYFKIAVAASGATAITTVDDGSVAAHLTIVADGNVAIKCTPDGKIELVENDGTVYTPNTVYSATTKAYVDAKVIQVATGTITQAEMNALHTTEKEIVAGQGIMQYILPLSCHLIIDRNTTQLTTGNLVLAYDGTATSFNFGQARRFMWNESGDRQLAIFIAPYEPSQSLLGGADVPLTLMMSAAITTDSLTSVDYHVTYMVWDRS